MRLWIADPDPTQRREAAWALRRQFDSVLELGTLDEVERALSAVVFDSVIEVQTGAWCLFALVKGAPRAMVMVAVREGELARRFRRLK